MCGIIFSDKYIYVHVLCRECGDTRRRTLTLLLAVCCVVDWDVHHGNGTQAFFENDPDLFYASTHQGEAAHDRFI